ncbi:MAG: hypothetical protein K6G09_12585 [Treponema sp.]|nr:hypothetical protein [Treponema sp.]
MRKIITAILVSITMGVGVFAQGVSGTNSDVFDSETFETEKTKTQIIIPTEQHTVDQTASVKIEYMPMYDEARIYYECMYVTYDRGEAMNTVLEVLADFQTEHKYVGYKYLRDDKEKYFKDDRNRRKAQYISYVKFSR